VPESTVAATPDPQADDLEASRQSLRFLWEWHQTYHQALQAEIQPQLETLKALTQKLDQRLIQIAAFGLVSRGKSTVLNALFGESLFPTGPLNGVTQWPRSARWVAGDPTSICFELIDTPGLDEVNGLAQAEIARTIAQQADLILFVAAGELTATEHQALRELRTVGKPLLLVLNKMDLFPDAVEAILPPLLADPQLQDLLSPDEILAIAAEPAPTQVRVEWPDGRSTYEWQASPPQVEPLRERLLTLLNQEGRSLLALNVLRQAEQVEEAIAAKVIALQNPEAQTLLWKFARLKALAVVLCPFGFIELGANLMVDLAFMRALARVYGLPMTHRGAGQVWGRILWSFAGLGLTEVSSHVLLGLNSLSEGVGGVSSYVGGAAAQAGVAAYGIWLVSQAAQTYLQQGCTWGVYGPSLVIKKICSHLPSNTVLSRLRRGQPSQPLLAPDPLPATASVSIK